MMNSDFLLVQWVLYVLPVLLIGVATSVEVSAQEADLILTGGKVITVNPANSVVEAMAIKGKKILRVGTDAEVLQTHGPNTTVVDLEGKTIMPGIIDSHTHAVWASVAEFDHRIPEMRTISDVLDYVRKRAEAKDDGEWIVVAQVFLTRLEERRYPTREELDGAAPNNPVFFRTGPDASLNTLALERFGIDEDYEAPEGSKVERKGGGTPTGILREWKGMVEIPQTGATPTLKQKAERMRMLVQDYNAVGITSFADRRVTDDVLAVYRRLRETGGLSARVAFSRYIDPTASLDTLRKQIRQIAREPLTTDGDLMMRTIGVKLFLDGGMLTGSAYMLEPWGISEMYAIDDPTYRGLRFVEPDKLREIARVAIENRLQFTAHSVGDGAVQTMAEVYQQLDQSMPTTSLRQTRPCITHCNFVSDEAIRIMDEVGIIADIQPPWLYMDGATLTDHFGYDRMKDFQPLRKLFEKGIVIGGGTDHMKKIGARRSINPYHPFLGMWTTIARHPRSYDGQLHPEQSLTRMQAVRMYTINNAYILFQENETGSLEEGKRADFIVIDRDILTCPVEEIKDIQVLETYLDGEQVYEQESKDD